MKCEDCVKIDEGRTFFSVHCFRRGVHRVRGAWCRQENAYSLKIFLIEKEPITRDETY